MTARDRMVVIAIAVFGVLGAGWLLVISPERKHATNLQNEVNSATSQLTAAESQLANARAAQARYSSAYASIVNLGKAVPPGREVPALVYELALASNQRHVDLSSIVYGASGGGGSSAGASQAANASLAGFTQMPFTFVFNGTFVDLYNLFQQLNHFTARTASGGLQVTGRLLTVQSAKLAPVTNGTEPGSKKVGPELLSGTITATAYVLPASQGLTGGATATSPGSRGSSASSLSSTGSGASAPSAPAIARVTP